jgi:actin-related protein
MELHRFEKRPIVLDVGSSSVKAGFAGEGTPRCILKTPTTIQNALFVSSGEPEKIKLCEEAVASLFRYIFFEELLVKPHEHRILICENENTTHVFRSTICKVAFTLFRTPSVLLKSTSACAMCCAGVASALVIDIGYSETRVCAFTHGVPLVHLSTSAAVGYQSLETYFYHRLETEWTLSGHGRDELLSHLEGIVRGACVVISEDEDSSSISDYHYKSNGCCISIKGKNRVESAEILFGNAGSEETSVLTAIVDALVALNYDCRLQASQNIILIGGTASIKGFANRLQEELRQLVKRALMITEKRMLGHPVRGALMCLSQSKIVPMPFTPAHVAWIGGSIIGNGDETASIDLLSWTNGKRLSDKRAIDTSLYHFGEETEEQKNTQVGGK